MKRWTSQPIFGALIGGTARHFTALLLHATAFQTALLAANPATSRAAGVGVVRVRRRPLRLLADGLLLLIGSWLCVASPSLVGRLALAPSSAPVDGMIDVGGSRLYLRCIGSGQPTVVLENGLPGTAKGWAFIQPVVAHTTRVCAYDRAGAGRSDPGLRPRTSLTLVQDLHRLLERAGVAPPYVLVGYSFGGLNVRVFTGLYPNEVAGLVLVDATHEAQRARFLALLPPASLAEDVGLQAFRTMVSEEWEDAAANPEGVTFEGSAAQVRASGSLGARPLVVLTARNHGFPKKITAEAEAGWQEMQTELAQLSSTSTHIVLDEVGHCIPCEQPAVVSAAIGRVVKAVRAQ